MAADLHIHIFEGITREEYERYHSNVLGSTYFNKYPYPVDDCILDKVDCTPSVFVGEVSWIKAVFSADPEKDAPTPFREIVNIIGDKLPVIEIGLVVKIQQALIGNAEKGYQIGWAPEILQFLRKHKGKRCFTITH